MTPAPGGAPGYGPAPMAGSPGWDIAKPHRFEVDGVRFRTGYRPLDDGSFTIVKSDGMMERYGPLCEAFAGQRIVEIGIAYGGSVALLNLLARPSAFLALELDGDERTVLTDLIRERGWEDRVRVELGVDQADRERVRGLAREVFGDGPIDLVIDDASHRYDPTRSSFEVLFPLLRPGGRYVIEDWNCDHWAPWAVRTALADPASEGHARAQELVARHGEGPPEGVVPLSRLALELVSARAESEGAVASVSVDDQWIVVERGPAELDPETFRLSDHAYDHFRQLSPVPVATGGGPGDGTGGGTAATTRPRRGRWRPPRGGRRPPRTRNR